MAPDDLRNALAAFVTLPVRAVGLTTAERHRELSLALDRLGAIIHFADAPDDETEYPAIETVPYKERYARWQSAFPGFGPYNMALPVIGLPTEATFASGDPYDDLADLSGDLQGVLDRWDCNSHSDAMAHLRLLHFHWGAHLRWLQLYLHERLGDDGMDE